MMELKLLVALAQAEGEEVLELEAADSFCSIGVLQGGVGV